MSPSITDLKVYMPAKNFELSKRFYAALGFKMSEGWGGTADFELNGSRRRKPSTIPSCCTFTILPVYC